MNLHPGCGVLLKRRRNVSRFASDYDAIDPPDNIAWGPLERVRVLFTTKIRCLAGDLTVISHRRPVERVGLLAPSFSKSSSFQNVPVISEPGFHKKKELMTPSPAANRMRASNRP
jgi:hypothetical protein